MGGHRKPRRAGGSTRDPCENLYRFIRLRLGPAISDREIARRWGMEWKSFAALKQGARLLPRLDELETLATGVLGVEPAVVFEVGRGVAAERVAAALAARPAGSRALRRRRGAVAPNARLLAAIYDHMPAACLLFDAEGTIRAANARAGDLCPTRAPAMIGNTAEDVFGAPGPAGCPVTRAFLSGRVESQLAAWDNADGRRRYVLRVAGPVIVRGRVEHVIETLADVTDAVERGDLRVIALWRGPAQAAPGARRRDERRASPRAPAAFFAGYALRDRRDRAAVINLGGGGLFLGTEQLAKRGEPIELDWTLPGDETVVRARGVIAWQRSAPDAGRRRGVGVRFVSLEPDFAPFVRAPERGDSGF